MYKIFAQPRQAVVNIPKSIQHRKRNHRTCLKHTQPVLQSIIMLMNILGMNIEDTSTRTQNKTNIVSWSVILRYMWIATLLEHIATITSVVSNLRVLKELKLYISFSLSKVFIIGSWIMIYKRRNEILSILWLINKFRCLQLLHFQGKKCLLWWAMIFNITFTLMQIISYCKSLSYERLKASISFYYFGLVLEPNQITPQIKIALYCTITISVGSSVILPSLFTVIFITLCYMMREEFFLLTKYAIKCSDKQKGKEIINNFG